MNESTKTALAVIGAIAIAAAFWLVLLAPKRDKVGKLGEQTSRIQAEVFNELARAESSEAAKQNFSKNYTELVVLGKAVPVEAETPSLLVQLDGVGNSANARFLGIVGGGGGESTVEPAAPTEGSVIPQPLGATAGPSGLLAMPYELHYEGGFFDIANFIQGIDSLVETKGAQVDAKGRLITIDGFNLAPLGGGSGKTSKLTASFSATTYVTPPGQGITAGATPAGPSEETVAEIP